MTRPVVPARRVAGVRYAVRDVVLVAREAAAAGRDLLYLNIGDPNQFDFETPPHVADAICRAIRDGKTSYAPSEGIPEALDAIRRRAEAAGVRAIRDAFVGNGASECIEVALTALLDPGDRVLLPAPGYPLYPALLAKIGAEEQPYFLDEARGWQPDLDDIAAKVDGRTRAIVLINPNNPTGAVCARETLEGVLELAARHGLVVFADEIYDRLVLDGGAAHVPLASLRDDVPVLTFNGLSKVFLGPGLRMGWCVTSGPEAVVRDYVEAMHRLLRARLCASHPVQHAIAPALDGGEAHLERVRAKLRARRDLTVQRLDAIDGISCVPPLGAFYAFPRLERVEDDLAWVQRLIRETGVVVVHGSGFGQRPGTAHFRVVFLPPDDVLSEAFARIADFGA